MITLSVSMMAHPKRAAQVEGILAQLDRKDVEVVWDERENRWDTGRRSMLAYDPRCSHHAVIQDDVLVCRDLFGRRVCDRLASFQGAGESHPSGRGCDRPGGSGRTQK